MIEEFEMVEPEEGVVRCRKCGKHSDERFAAVAPEESRRRLQHYLDCEDRTGPAEGFSLPFSDSQPPDAEQR